MPSPQKRTTNLCRLGGSRSDSDQPLSASAALAHLAFMEPTNTPEVVAHAGDEVVLRGVFEPALTLKELAARLHVSVQTLYDLRSQGRGPTGFRVGKHLRFRQSEIEAWLLRMEDEDVDRHPSGGRR